jgi:hypothetical protein
VLPPPDPQAARGRIARSGRDPANDHTAEWGYVCAFLVPLIGIILGIVLWSRTDDRAADVIGLSIVMGLIYAVLLTLLGAA